MFDLLDSVESLMTSSEASFCAIFTPTRTTFCVSGHVLNECVWNMFRPNAAVDISVAKTKLPDSEVAGQASVLIFPDLNTGNNTYKAIQRETGALAIGPMLQGLNKPVNDLSRGCTVDDIFNTILLTAIQAEQN